jgi:lipoyl(octanoyl) transferase
VGRSRLLTRATLRHPAHLIDLGLADYDDAWLLQRALAEAVKQGTLPDTVVFCEHPPTVTLGRRTDPGELHIPAGAEVTVVETDRGGRSTYHAPGQLVCYPILDLNRHGRDVRGYCRRLEQAIVATIASLGVEATIIDGLTGVWVADGRRSPAKIASIGIHISRWVTTHGYALNVDLDPAPFNEWITACGLEDAAFTSLARELGRSVAIDEVRSRAAAALGDEFALAYDHPLGPDRAEWPEPLRAALAAGEAAVTAA